MLMPKTIIREILGYFSGLTMLTDYHISIKGQESKYDAQSPFLVRLIVIFRRVTKF
jgi:hypothetical protein